MKDKKELLLIQIQNINQLRKDEGIYISYDEEKIKSKNIKDIQVSDFSIHITFTPSELPNNFSYIKELSGLYYSMNTLYAYEPKTRRVFFKALKDSTYDEEFKELYKKETEKLIQLLLV